MESVAAGIVVTVRLDDCGLRTDISFAAIWEAQPQIELPHCQDLRAESARHDFGQSASKPVGRIQYLALLAARNRTDQTGAVDGAHR